MSILHTYAEAAVRRDLIRARSLLGVRARLSTERRRALADHLHWLGSLAQPGTALVSPAVARFCAATTAFGETGTALEREALVRTIDAVLKVTASHPSIWTAPEVVRIACGNLPWVLDEATVRGGPGLVLPPTGMPQDARWQAAEYRRKRSMLWGPIALAPLKVG
jgi:hypothetical protein